MADKVKDNAGGAAAAAVAAATVKVLPFGHEPIFSMPNNTEPYHYEKGKDAGTVQYRVANVALVIGGGSFILPGCEVVALLRPTMGPADDLDLEFRLPKIGGQFSKEKGIVCVDSDLGDAWAKMQADICTAAASWRETQKHAASVNIRRSGVSVKRSALGIK